MRSERHANTLLVELLIVIFFFMIGSVIIMQVFEKSFQLSHEAEAGTRALAEAQSIADELYAGDSVEETLQRLGFAPAGEAGGEAEAQDSPSAGAGVWTLAEEAYQLTVTCTSEETGAGALMRASISAAADGEELFTIPCVRYRGA